MSRFHKVSTENVEYYVRYGDALKLRFCFGQISDIRYSAKISTEVPKQLLTLLLSEVQLNQTLRLFMNTLYYLFKRKTKRTFLT